MKKLFVILVGVLFLVFAVVVEAQDPEPLTDAFERPGISPLWGSNSEYMIGDVAVGVVFVESDGTIDTETEDWTTAEMDAVEAEIEAGLAWWTAREPRASLSFEAEFTRVNSSYEAINRSPNGYWLYMPEVLAAMGYSGTEAFTYADDYNNDLVDRYDTDWAFTIFVVDSSNDPDGKFFASHLFAFAFKGGPLMVLTYDVGTWGVEHMKGVAAHEVGHIFGAKDQVGGTDCYAVSGYLDVPNYNSASCPWPTHPSIMKHGFSAYSAGQIDHYARGQVGWWDRNCNDVLDPIDEDIEVDSCFYVYVPIILKE